MQIHIAFALARGALSSVLQENVCNLGYDLQAYQ
jgi:hypothetical protein